MLDPANYLGQSGVMVDRVLRAAPAAAARRATDLAHLMQRVYALVLAGGRGTRLHQLTDHRAKPALPFAGKLNIIDFALSNCVNSGIRRIGVLTQYKAQSLIRHIERGWGFLQSSLGEFIDIVPAQQQHGRQLVQRHRQRGVAEPGIVREARPELVLVLAGDHVYKMDYARLIAEHVGRGADATVACVEVPLDEARPFGVMAVDDQGRVLSFTEKPSRARTHARQARSCAGQHGHLRLRHGLPVCAAGRRCRRPDSQHDFGRDLIPYLVRHHRVHAHRFADSCVNMVGDKPYWRDVGTIDAYWEANMDLTHVTPELNLYDDDWPILSLQRQVPPAKFVFDDDALVQMLRDGAAASTAGCRAAGCCRPAAAAALGLTLAHVEGVAGFYRFFHLQPVGRYRCCSATTSPTACWQRGADGRPVPAPGRGSRARCATTAWSAWTPPRAPACATRARRCWSTTTRW
jgi:glucose-1-phosphate adenylyltransferase